MEGTPASTPAPIRIGRLPAPGEALLQLEVLANLTHGNTILSRNHSEQKPTGFTGFKRLRLQSNSPTPTPVPVRVPHP